RHVRLLNDRGHAQSSFVFPQCIGEEGARVGPPGCFGIAQSGERFRIGVETLDAGGQGSPAFRRVEIAGKLDHGRIVEPWIAVERSPPAKTNSARPRAGFLSSSSTR